MSLTETIKREALALGFDAVGIATVHPAVSDTLLQRIRNWLAHRYHGTMAWMSGDPARRADPRLVLPECRSIISLGMNYDTGHYAKEGPGYGIVARYARGKDYHLIFGERLKQLEAKITTLVPGTAIRSYVDTGPVMEKAWAQEAGLGWIGKHSNLVSSEHGSWLVLGEILTTLDLAPDEPAADLCGSCRLCIQACPTGAIVEPYIVDANRCISYLTIEYRGAGDSISEDLRSRMGNHIFGCDDCLDVCPFNLRADTRTDAVFSTSPVTLAPILSDLAGLTQSEFVDRFKDSPIRRARWPGFLRNVAIARANEDRRKQRPSAPLPSLAK